MQKELKLRKEGEDMHTLPGAELEIMMIIWEYDRPVTRPEIDKRLEEKGRFLNKTSVLTYLSRLHERGFVKITKEGKSNIFEALISESEYTSQAGSRILEHVFRGSVKNFVCALYDGKSITKHELEELRQYIDEKMKEPDEDVKDVQSEEG